MSMYMVYGKTSMCDSTGSVVKVIKGHIKLILKILFKNYIKCKYIKSLIYLI